MHLFISHIHEERMIAEAIRDQLNSCFGAQVDVFLAEDIPLGANWFDKIKAALGGCDVIIVLFSKYSIGRPWINIEAGYGVMAGKQVIPVCHSCFTKTELPVIYGLLQVVELLRQQDIERLLDQIARATQAKQFLGDKVVAVSRWIKEVSEAVRSTPRLTLPLDAPPCVWVIGSNRGLSKNQSNRNRRFIGFLATALIQRRFRVVFGRSGLLDALGNAMSNNTNPVPIYGIDWDILAEFGSESAMQSNFATAPPNPVVVLGALRSKRGVGTIFMDSIGHLPDVALIIGGSLSGRTHEEAAQAIEAGISVLPIKFTGGAAATLDSSIHNSLSDSITRIQQATRDFSQIAQLVCDVIEQQTRICRDIESKNVGDSR